MHHDVSMALPPDIRELLEAQVDDSPHRLVRVIDYLLVMTYDHGGRIPAGFEGPFELTADIHVKRLDQQLGERLLRATELRGENWEGVAARQDHVVHAYVRQVWDGSHTDPPDGLYKWDTDGRLYPCIQLSRLVRDNATSTEYAVQRLIHADGSERLVPFDGFDSHVAYRLYPERPGWLDLDEAGQLTRLLEAFWDGPPLPARVGRALRRTDIVTRERYLEDALPLVVGGLEALLKVDRAWARAQFAERVSAVASELGVTLSGAQCQELYDDRSALVHGSGVDLSQRHERSAFEQGFVALQETLRRTVRLAIEDPGFGSTFADDSRITARWPTVVVARDGTQRTI